MNFCLQNIPGLVKRLPLLFLIIAVLMPTAESSSAQAVEVIVEDPSA